MCFDRRLIYVLVCLAVGSCASYKVMRKVNSGEVAVGFAVPEDRPLDDSDVQSVTDNVESELPDGPIIMNAIRDTETGEMVATDIISASKVTARFRNVPERGGYVSIGFDLSVPSSLTRSEWKLMMEPYMVLQDDTLSLESIHVAGRAYREAQLRGYQRYRRFLESIITDSTDFVRIGQLEIFLKRNFPQTYAMKTDSSFVSEPQAENLFGVTQREALEHYTRKWKKKLNDRRLSNRDRMYARYVKDPLAREGVRLDTVVADGDGFIYRYSHRFRSRPHLKKAVVFLQGGLYRRGEKILSMPESDDMTFYISSLSTLADMTQKYRIKILERTVYDNTKALIDFAQGSSGIDTLLGDNASELERVCRCIGDVVERQELVLDSLIVSASCSPEGRYEHNRRLALSRAEEVRRYLMGKVPEQWKDAMKVSCVPENWDIFRKLVKNDTVMAGKEVERVLGLTADLGRPDDVERRLASLPSYRYMREKIYPKLRSVSFDFHLHRSGMVKDTVHTTEPDTVYMSGLEALRDLDYKRAVTILRPYGDYNSALAYLSAEYNHSALEVLKGLDDEDPRVCYLMAVTLSRLEQPSLAQAWLGRAVKLDPYLRHRANLDPEMAVFAAAIKDDY